MENQQMQQAGSQGSRSDAEKNKTMAIVGYIFSFLFFIPLISEDSKNSPFAKYHANQQLLLLIYWIGGGMVVFIISLILVFTIFLPILLWFVFSICGIVLIILGVINASNGEMKALPVIGDIKLLN
jgi:uncharacterized membrane protein